jgi:hypothetical protein
MQAADRGFTSVLIVTFPAAKGFEAERNRAAAGFAELSTVPRQPDSYARTSPIRTSFSP